MGGERARAATDRIALPRFPLERLAHARTANPPQGGRLGGGGRPRATTAARTAPRLPTPLPPQSPPRTSPPSFLLLRRSCPSIIPPSFSVIPASPPAPTPRRPAQAASALPPNNPGRDTLARTAWVPACAGMTQGESATAVACGLPLRGGEIEWGRAACCVGSLGYSLRCAECWR